MQETFLLHMKKIIKQIDCNQMVATGPLLRKDTLENRMLLITAVSGQRRQRKLKNSDPLLGYGLSC